MNERTLQEQLDAAQERIAVLEQDRRELAREYSKLVDDYMGRGNTIDELSTALWHTDEVGDTCVVCEKVRKDIDAVRWGRG